MTRERIPVDPKNIDVLGHRVTPDDAAWTGLDWSHAEAVNRDDGWSYLRMPWCHPQDQTGDPEDFDCIYRVYPRAEPGKKWKRKMVKGTAFVMVDGKWWIDVEFARQPEKDKDDGR